MNKKMKQIGSLMVILLMMCTLTSCTKDQGVKIIEEESNDQTYLNFFSVSGVSANNVTKYWSDQFSERYHQEIYVNYDSAGYYADEGLSYREMLEKRLSSSLPDDIYIINAEDVMDFDQKGYWMDLSDMDFVNQISDTALYQSTYDGKVFSLPLSCTGFGFFWNVDVLKKYNLEIPSNLEEFMKVCETLKANGIMPYCGNKGFALTVPAMSVGLADLYGNDNTEDHIDALNAGTTMMSSYMKDGYEFLSMLVEKGYLDAEQAINTAPGDDVKLFLGGEYGFICGAMSSYDLIKNKTFEVQLTGLPVLKDGYICVYGANSRLCINPNSKHLDTAKKFVEMIGTTDALDMTAELNHTMSSAKDSNLKVPKDQIEMWELLKQPGQIPNQDFTLHFNTWESIRDVGREVIQGLSVEEACEKLDAKQRQELKAYAEK